VVDKVIGINGKPFDAADYNEESRKLLERMLFDVADAVDTGELIPRAMALTIVQDNGEPSFWYSCREQDVYMLYGAGEAMQQTFWETVVKGDGE